MLPDEIIKAGNNFNPGFRVTDELGQADYWTMWEGSFDATTGITGLWFPRENWMVVTKRGMSHHNTAYRQVHERHGHISPVMPWAANLTTDSWHVDIPSSAGGMAQVLARLDGGGDVDSWQRGNNITPDHLWPPLWTCRVLDVPEAGVVNAKYTHSGLQSADPYYNESEVFELEEAYTEMRFLPGGPPEPKLDRGQYL